MANKLFIPGPTEVREEVLMEMANPQIGHRTEEFKQLFRSLKPGLQEIFGTRNDVLVSTSSGSGFWEACIRSCVNAKVLHAVNGAFSKKWADVSSRCGKAVSKVEYEPGKAVRADDIARALEGDDYDAFCLVHNETSTGVESDLDEIAEVMKNHPSVLWFVDAVSSAGGICLDVDRRNIDFCLTSGQKAIAIPPGLAFASVSQRCYKKAESVNGKGYYFDILELKKMYDKDMTPYTPSIPHLYALKKQLERIKAEGLDNRFKRMKEMALYTREWAVRNGFEIFAEEGHSSGTITCIRNTKGVDMNAVKAGMAKKGYSIDSGYSKMNAALLEKGLKPTFRIAHMGDLTLDEIKSLTSEIEKYF